MWLLPIFSRVSDVATRVYFRRTVAGNPVPSVGPCLLVANHPNSLVDPAMVVAAARRPVRFLARAPLFVEGPIRFLIRGSGAIPVHRRQDDPGMMERNAETFAAVFDALAEGSAVGIFPEGISHDEPGLTPLKTGAARIALGAVGRVGGPFPVLPVGLSFRQKDVFRSEALVLVGEPVEWADLAPSGESAEAVRTLTARIDTALRSVTVNLERWEDALLVETAEAIFAAESGADGSPTSRVARVGEASRLLTEMRRDADPDLEGLARDLSRHARVLRKLALSPTDLHSDTRNRTAMRWAVARLPYLSLVPVAILLLGTLLFWPPYRAAGLVADRARVARDLRATYKLLGGFVAFTLWISALAGLGALLGGPLAGLVLGAALPVVALLTLGFHERSASILADARRYVWLRGRKRVRGELLQRQRELYLRLMSLLEARRGAPVPHTGSAT
jgi:glycerol-3-phosphate O-acyltransferase / dihydroxyacetone phosphate acyltransferase